MSDHHVIEQVSLLLQGLLFEGLSGEGPVAGQFTAPANISMASPADILDDTADADLPVLMSVYLYQVAVNPHVKNRALIPSGPNEQRYPPIALDLYYLVTPLGDSPTDNQVILARAMQILDAHATIRAEFLDSDLRPTRPELRLMIDPVSLEELTRIWNAFNQAYHLSVCYKAQFVALDSSRPAERAAPVVEEIIDVHQIDAGETPP